MSLPIKGAFVRLLDLVSFLVLLPLDALLALVVSFYNWREERAKRLMWARAYAVARRNDARRSLQ